MPNNRSHRRSGGPSPSNPSEAPLIISPGSVIEVEPSLLRADFDYSTFTFDTNVEVSPSISAVDPAPIPVPWRSYNFSSRSTSNSPYGRSNSQQNNRSLPFAYKEYWQCEKEEWTPGHNRINDGYSFKDMQESFHRNFAVVWEKLTRDSYTVVLQSGRHDFDVYYYKKIRFISLKKSRLLPSGPAVNKIGGGIVYAERQKEQSKELIEQQINQQRAIRDDLFRRFFVSAADPQEEF